LKCFSEEESFQPLQLFFEERIGAITDIEKIFSGLVGVRSLAAVNTLIGADNNDTKKFISSVSLSSKDFLV
jgi:hypothetical protein